MPLEYPGSQEPREMKEGGREDNPVTKVIEEYLDFQATKVSSVTCHFFLPDDSLPGC